MDNGLEGTILNTGRIVKKIWKLALGQWQWGWRQRHVTFKVSQDRLSVVGREGKMKNELHSLV
jgi:hypothetical protein